LEASAHIEPSRKYIRDRAPSDGAFEGVPIEQDRSRHDLQACCRNIGVASMDKTNCQRSFSGYVSPTESRLLKKKLKLPPDLARHQHSIIAHLGSHKVAGVRRAIEATGARLLYLPPYSPDLNPIEQAFAKLKALLRARALRTVEALWNALGDIVACFSPTECANFLRHAGYF
jgi:transposase